MSFDSTDLRQVHDAYHEQTRLIHELKDARDDYRMNLREARRELRVLEERIESATEILLHSDAPCEAAIVEAVAALAEPGEGE